MKHLISEIHPRNGFASFVILPKVTRESIHSLYLKDPKKRGAPTETDAHCRPCNRVFLSIGAPLGNLEGIRLPGHFDSKG